MSGRGQRKRPHHGMRMMNEIKGTTRGRFPFLRRMGTAVAVVALLSAGAGEAAAQQAGDRRLEDVFTAQQSARVREIAREAQEEGVPAGLIIRKAFEGAAKGYPPARIVSALDDYAGRLRQASHLLGPDVRPAALAAGAEALRRGVAPDLIRDLALRRGQGRDLAVPLIVLGDLTDAGIPADRALEMVGDAMNRGTRGDEMLALSAAVRRQMRQGADWRTALETVRRRIERQQMRRDRPPVPPGTEPPHRLRDDG
jgi:hypothetical protein